VKCCGCTSWNPLGLPRVMVFSNVFFFVELSCTLLLRYTRATIRFLDPQVLSQQMPCHRHDSHRHDNCTLIPPPYKPKRTGFSFLPSKSAHSSASRAQSTRDLWKANLCPMHSHSPRMTNPCRIETKFANNHVSPLQMCPVSAYRNPRQHKHTDL
jgi:hypothetical protein